MSLDFDGAMEGMKDVIIKTLITVEHQIVN